MTKREKSKIYIRICRRLNEEPSNTKYTSKEVEKIVMDVLLGLPGPKDINIKEDVIKDDLHEDIFGYLNCFEVPAWTVRDGNTFIDSEQAEEMTNEIISMILNYNEKV